MKNPSTRKIVLVALMSAISIVLYAFEIPMPFPGASYLKFDLSDVPAVVTGIVAGPLYGIAVELVKNIIHAFTMSKEGIVGEFANFAYGFCFVLPVAFLYKKKGIRSLLGFGLSILVSTVAMYFINLYITFPLYYPNGFDATVTRLLLTAFTPFNLVKGVIVSISVFLVMKSLGRYLEHLK